MDGYIDIKYFIIKHQKGDLTLKETFDEINKYIQDNGCYSGDDMKLSFELGEKKELNTVASNNDILNSFINDDTIDKFLNYIINIGFFIKTDIDNVYNAGIKNTNNTKLNGDILKDLCVQSFKQYLITKYN